MRADALLELQHQPHGILIELADARLLEIRIVGAHLPGDAFQHAVEMHAFDIHHHAIGIGQGELLVFQFDVGFQRDAGISGGRPDAHGNHVR